MSRSYGFDHFTAPKTGQPKPPRGKKPHDRTVQGGKRKGGAPAAPRESSPRVTERRRAQAAPATSPRGGTRRGVSPPPLESGARRRRDVRDTWMQAGEHARGLREGAEQFLRAGRELVRLPLDLVRALRGAAHEG